MCSLKLLTKIGSIDNLCLDGKTFAKLCFPFFAEHGGADDQKTPRSRARLQFFPDVNSRDGLTETDLVRNENSSNGRFNERQYRAKLMRKELSFAAFHGVIDVCQSAADLLGQEMPHEIIRPSGPLCGKCFGTRFMFG